MRERLELAVALHDAGEELRALRIIGSPVQGIRSCFDLMATDTEDDWELVARRMERGPRFDRELRARRARGHRARARRRAAPGDRLRGQAATWGGDADDSDDLPFFAALAVRHNGSTVLHNRLAQAADEATAAYARLAAFLRDEYAPEGRPA